MRITKIKIKNGWKVRLEQGGAVYQSSGKTFDSAFKSAFSLFIECPNKCEEQIDTTTEYGSIMYGSIMYGLIMTEESPESVIL